MSTATAPAQASALSRPSWHLPLRRGPYLTGTTGSARLSGIDAARGLAVLGMIVAHLGATTCGLTSVPGVLSLAHGRSSVLFATVAGLSVGIMSGRRRPHRGEQLVRTRTRVLTRSALLLVLGALMAVTTTPVAVILGFYAAWTVLALPFLTWSPRRLLVLAAATAATGPVLVQVGPLLLTSAGLDTGESGGDGNMAVVSFFLTGTYPGLVWMAYIFLGLALSRLDLGSARTLWRLAGTGVLCAALGYGGAVAVGQALGLEGHDVVRIVSPQDAKACEEPAAASQEPGSLPVAVPGSQGVGSPTRGGSAGADDASQTVGPTNPAGADDASQTVGPTSPAGGEGSGGAEGSGGSQGPEGDQGPTLLAGQDVLSGLVTAAPHSNTFFEALGSGGVAMVVIALAQLVARRSRLVLAPLAAVGSMSLTVYCAHIVAIHAGDLMMSLPGSDSGSSADSTATWMCLVAVALAMAWFAVFARGPLEHVVHVISVRTATPRE